MECLELGFGVEGNISDGVCNGGEGEREENNVNLDIKQAKEHFRSHPPPPLVNTRPRLTWVREQDAQ